MNILKPQTAKLGFAIAFATIHLARSGSAELQIGASAPPLAFKTMLQTPEGAKASWPELKGRVVVLEFWATWCVSCIQSISHLNELADALPSSAVQFIAITDESPQTVASFLKRKPIHAWVGLDTAKTHFDSYGVSSIPHTVIVDKEGKIAAITRPGDLTKHHLEDLLAGLKPAFAASGTRKGFTFRPGELPDASGQAQKPDFQIMIRPSESLNRGSGGGGGKFTFLGSDVRHLLRAAWGVNENRLIVNTELTDDRYDAVVNVPAADGSDAGRQWLRQAVEASFHLRTKREVREVDAWVVTVAKTNADSLSVTLSTGGSSSKSDLTAGRMEAMNNRISTLLGDLENLLKTPVVDETGLTNRYDWNLQWEVKPASDLIKDAVIKAVREQLGLDMRIAKRPVQFIVVDKTEP